MGTYVHSLTKVGNLEKNDVEMHQITKSQSLIVNHSSQEQIY